MSVNVVVGKVLKAELWPFRSTPEIRPQLDHQAGKRERCWHEVLERQRSELSMRIKLKSCCCIYWHHSRSAAGLGSDRAFVRRLT